MCLDAILCRPSTSAEEARRSPARTAMEHSETVTLIVYVYWRGVQSWAAADLQEGEDNANSSSSSSSRTGRRSIMMLMPGGSAAELVSWHIKGLEYDLVRRRTTGTSGEGDSAALTFEMGEEEVFFYVLLMVGISVFLECLV